MQKVAQHNYTDESLTDEEVAEALEYWAECFWEQNPEHVGERVIKWLVLNRIY